MEKREQYLYDLKTYIENVDKETTLLLQNLQWDYKHIIESTSMVSCEYVSSHRIPLQAREDHEKKCYLALHGYNYKDALLPDTINPNASTVVKLNNQDIKQIINMALAPNPTFRRATLAEDIESLSPEPLSLERLQLTYTADERRAIYDAVVSAAPACHDLADLALVSSNDGAQVSKVKSRAEILAELRNMKRRRAKYRVAAKTRNYSDVLRDVIKTQMELYAEAKGINIKTEYGSNSYVSQRQNSDKSHNDGKIVPSPIIIKQERLSPETDTYSESSRRYEERTRSNDRNYENHRRYHDVRQSKNRSDYVENMAEQERFRENKNTYSSRERRRNDDRYTERDPSSNTEEINVSKDRREDYWRRHENGQSNNNKSYSTGHSKHSKYDRNYENDSPKSKYESSTREYRTHDRRYRDKDYNTSHEKYRNDSKDRYRERKHKSHDIDRIKEERYDPFEDYTNEKKRRKKHL